MNSKRMILREITPLYTQTQPLDLFSTICELKLNSKRFLYFCFIFLLLFYFAEKQKAIHSFSFVINNIHLVQIIGILAIANYIYWSQVKWISHVSY